MFVLVQRCIPVLPQRPPSQITSKRPLTQFQVDGRLLEIVDDAWKKEKLPEEDIAVPIAELPDPEADNGAQGESMKEQESKWTDLGLNQLAESTNANASS